MKETLVPSFPCDKCGIPVYIPFIKAHLGFLSPICYFACDCHGPKRKIKWDDLTPDQQEQLMKISVVAAVKLRLEENASKPSSN